MVFVTEPTGYEKGPLSNLQGAWSNLRSTVVSEFGFPDSDKLLFNVDEGMSWESVRDLEKMKMTLLLVRNIAIQASSPEDVLFWLEEVKESLDGVFEEIKKGKIL